MPSTAVALGGVAVFADCAVLLATGVALFTAPPALLAVLLPEATGSWVLGPLIALDEVEDPELAVPSTLPTELP